MFVKKIPRWKIKRFIKGVIRSILFFVVLSSFIFNCFAAENWVYSSFDDWVSRDGFVSYHLRNSSSNIVKSGEFYGDSSDLNEMVFAKNYSSSFDSVLMTINDSPNVNVKFNSGDTLVLRHQIAIHMADGVINDDYAEKFTVDINYTYDDGFKNGTLSFRFDDALSGYNYIQYDYGVSVFYNVDIQSVFSNNIVNGEITSIDYHFYDITSNSYSFQIFPSYNESSIIFYVGSSQNAPIYPSPNNSASSDLVESEEDLLASVQSGIERFKSLLISLPSSIVNCLAWLSSAGSIFTLLFNRVTWQLSSAIYVLLGIGLLSFVIGVSTQVISKFKR